MEQSQIFWKERWKRDDSEDCDGQELPAHLTPTLHLTDNFREALAGALQGLWGHFTHCHDN